MTKKNINKILSRGDTVGGKQVQNDEARDCHATARNDAESGRFTSSLSFPCLTRESTWCGLNAPRCAQYAQSGRSMVEMLGVLAVIGVLSVAGIAGYSIAMNQYRANEAINRAMLVAVMASSQRLLNPSAVLTDLEDGVAMGNDANNIVLTLSNIDDKVRSRIENMGLKNATVSTGENGALVFTFNNDLSERSSSSNSGQQQNNPCANVTCQNGGTCLGGVCDCTGTGYTGEYCQNLIQPVTPEGFEPCEYCFYGNQCFYEDVGKTVCAFDDELDGYVVLECPEEATFGTRLWTDVESGSVIYQDNRCTQRKS